MPALYTCEVSVSDERCPDGCCGRVCVYLKSPRTGAWLLVNPLELPAKVREVLPSGGTITAAFSVPELRHAWQTRENT